MNDASLYESWRFWLVVAVVLVVAAAALLLMVYAAAMRILRLATAALALVKQTRENTASIWELQDTNEVAEEIRNEAKAINEHLSLVSGALHRSNGNK
jgi:hypothetical protein